MCAFEEEGEGCGWMHCWKKSRHREEVGRKRETEEEKGREREKRDQKRPWEIKLEIMSGRRKGRGRKQTRRKEITRKSEGKWVCAKVCVYMCLCVQGLAQAAPGSLLWRSCSSPTPALSVGRHTDGGQQALPHLFKAPRANSKFNNVVGSNLFFQYQNQTFCL